MISDPNAIHNGPMFVNAVQGMNATSSTLPGAAGLTAARAGCAEALYWRTVRASTQRLGRLRLPPIARSSGSGAARRRPGRRCE
jgi:hypothetical protein